MCKETSQMKRMDLRLLVREILESQGGESKISSLKGDLAKAAQKVYDEWEQDEEGNCDWLGMGGICQDIADAMAGVLTDNGIECSPVSQSVGEQHVYVIAKNDDGVYEVDIPPRLYETGGGYCWKKIPGVRFDQRYVVVTRISTDPEEFDQYIQDY